MSNELKPCPLCGREVSVSGGDEEWRPTFGDPDSGGDPYHVRCDCGLDFCAGCVEYDEFVERWNRRASDKPLDIKGQLLLVRDKCPDVWDFNYRAGVGLGCPSHYGIVDKSEYCVDTDECKECWDKALEGDANE